MPYESLRPYLGSLEQQGLLRWIDQPVDKDWEISAIGRMIFRGMAENRRYGLGFRNIKGYPGARVVSGVIAASTKMMSVGLECDPTPAAIHEATIQGISHPIEAKVVKTGPCKEVKLGPDKLDLTKLPIPVWTPGKDAGPYLTPLWVTKDPDNGVRNVGIRRAQIKGPNKTGILFGAPDRGGAIHHEKWKARGKPMPAAIYVGSDPVHYLVAPGRYGTDELAIAGGIRGQAVEVVKCETVDIEVPATAEIVIEGEIPTDYIETEGPFGEFTGFMAGGREMSGLQRQMHHPSQGPDPSRHHQPVSSERKQHDQTQSAGGEPAQTSGADAADTGHRRSARARIRRMHGDSLGQPEENVYRPRRSVGHGDPRLFRHELLQMDHHRRRG